MCCAPHHGIRQPDSRFTHLPRITRVDRCSCRVVSISKVMANHRHSSVAAIDHIRENLCRYWWVEAEEHLTGTEVCPNSYRAVAIVHGGGALKCVRPETVSDTAQHERASVRQRLPLSCAPTLAQV